MYERKDAYYRKAKANGLRSRSAFKLEDLDRGLMRPGDRVLDLGSWPGGWLQTAARRVGERGLVVGVDLQRLQPLGLPNVRVIQGDVADERTLEEILQTLGGSADAVLSDMAPKLTGIRSRDQARASELVRLALAVARRAVRKGGGFVCKVFMSPDYAAILEEVRGHFDQVSATRSGATRKGSAELYVIAKGFRRA